MTKSAGKFPVADGTRGLSLRTALVSTVATAFIMGLASSADAYYPRRARYFSQGGWYGDFYPHYPRYPQRFRATSRGGGGAQERAEPKKDAGFGDLPKGPLQLIVNISTQKVTLYSNGVRVAQGPVSTGVPGHPTPRGVFSIIEKDRYHHSNIYSGAPMPFMQRITWSGVAIHEGVLPGHPASHGCIRTSHDFAQKLWPITKLGVRFIVTRHDVEPADFEHPKLFAPKQKPADRIAQNESGAVGTFALIKLAQAPAQSQSDAAGLPGGKSDTSESAAEAIEQAKPAEDVKRSQDDTTVEIRDERLNTTGTIEAPQPVSTPSIPTELRKSVDVPAEQTAEVAPAAAAPLAPAADEIAKPAPTVDPAKPMAPWRKSADQPVKRVGQVAVFVSRKEKKIFVRQGMVPMFEMPIAIEAPDTPLGTHVFTALGMTDDGAMRWNVMTIPTDGSILESEGRRRFREPPKIIYSSKPPSTAAQALNRIQFPQEALDRISELLTPGSSLVISDEGLGRETGRGTEFIVLLRE